MQPTERSAPAPARDGRGTARDVLEVARVFTRLGCTSFGGPTAHVGFIRAECVDRRGWLDDARYAELVALCQFLPGPASSQLVFALGMHRAGLVGALVASACFTLPSALLMLALAQGLAGGGALERAGWLHGLRVVAVGVVAQAVWVMGKKLCPDAPRKALVVLTAALVTALCGAPAQLAALALGALVGASLRLDAASLRHAPAPPPRAPHHHAAAALALAIFAALLVALPLIAAATGSRVVAELDAFYRAGSLVFGGGHVVMPLLRAELCPRGWLADDRFLAGYAAAQAVPGPLFSFAGYLGAAMHPGPSSWAHGVSTLLAIFTPAWLLVGGALPFWRRLGESPAARAALAGANASVVGLLLAALYRPVVTESIHRPRDVLAALVAFALLEAASAPPWLVVALGAALGEAWLGP